MGAKLATNCTSITGTSGIDGVCPTRQDVPRHISASEARGGHECDPRSRSPRLRSVATSLVSSPRTDQGVRDAEDLAREVSGARARISRVRGEAVMTKTRVLLLGTLAAAFA